jgi:hypothetical protein
MPVLRRRIKLLAPQKSSSARRPSTATCLAAARRPMSGSSSSILPEHVRHQPGAPSLPAVALQDVEELMAAPPLKLPEIQLAGWRIKAPRIKGIPEGIWSRLGPSTPSPGRVPMNEARSGSACFRWAETAACVLMFALAAGPAGGHARASRCPAPRPRPGKRRAAEARRPRAVLARRRVPVHLVDQARLPPLPRQRPLCERCPRAAPSAGHTWGAPGHEIARLR